MKAKYLLPIALFLSGHTIAQNIQLGVDGGVNLSNLANKWEGEVVSGENKVGFNAGVFANIVLGDIVSVQPSLRYSMKGSKVSYAYSNSDLSYSRESNLSLHYIELPVNLVFSVSGNSRPSGVFVGIGPYAAVLVDAKEKYSEELKPSVGGDVRIVRDRSADLKIGSHDGIEYLRRMDYGGQAFVAYKWNNVMLKLGGQMGFAQLRYNNVKPVNSGLRGGETFQRNNYVFFLNVGFLFGGSHTASVAKMPTSY